MTNTEQIAKRMGVSPAEVEKMLNVLAYRKEYNSRPDVQAKRREYSRRRNLKMSILSKLLKEEVA